MIINEFNATQLKVVFGISKEECKNKKAFIPHVNKTKQL